MNRMMLSNSVEGYIHMETIKNDIITNDNNFKIQNNTYLLNGYKIKLKYSDGKTFYDCMENAVKRLSENLKYNNI